MNKEEIGDLNGDSQRSKMVLLRKASRTSLKVFAVFATAMILLSAFVMADIEYSIEVPDDFPWEFTFYPGPLGNYAKLTFKNASKDTPVFVRFENVSTDTDLVKDGQDMGDIEAGITNFYIFTIENGTEPYLRFFVNDGVKVKIDKIEDSIIGDVNKSHVFGETFYEMGGKYIADLGFESLEAKNINITTPGNLTYMGLIEYPAFVDAICRYGWINETTTSFDLPPGTKTLRLVSDAIEDFDMKVTPIKMEDVAVIDVIATRQSDGVSKYVRTITPVGQYYDINLSCEDSVNTIAANSSTIFKITIENSGNGNDTVDMEAESIWNATFLDPVVEIEHIGFGYAYVMVTAPPGSEGENRTLQVNATSRGNQSKKSTTNITVHSKSPSYSFKFNSSIISKEVYPKQSAWFYLDINNTGNVEDTYDLELDIDNSTNNWSIELDTTSIRIDTNDTASVRLVVTPPMNATGGSYLNFSFVIASSHNITNNSQSINLTTRVVKVYGVDLSPDYQVKENCSLSTTVVFPLLVQNSGNMPDTIDLTITSGNAHFLDSLGMPVSSIAKYSNAFQHVDVNNILYLHANTANWYNTTWIVEVRGTSQNNSAISETVKFELRTIAMGAHPGVDGENWAVRMPVVEPGDVIIPVENKEKLSFEIKITNKGDYADNFTITNTTTYSTINEQLKDANFDQTRNELLLSQSLIDSIYPMEYATWSPLSENNAWSSNIDVEGESDPYRIYLEVNETKTIVLNVTVANNSPVGEMARINIKANATGNSSAFDVSKKYFILTKAIGVEVGGDYINEIYPYGAYPQMNGSALFSVYCNQSISTARPGNSTTYRIYVSNNDDYNMVFNLSIYGVPEDWQASLDNYSISVEKYALGEVNLTVTTPVYGVLPLDQDIDGLNNSAEVNSYKTMILNPDTDNDMIWDGAEADYWSLRGLSIENISANLNNNDVDGDGLLDGDELFRLTNVDGSTDDDTLSDFDEIYQYFTFKRIEIEQDFYPGPPINATFDFNITMEDSYRLIVNLYSIINTTIYDINETETLINQMMRNMTFINISGDSHEFNSNGIPEYINELDDDNVSVKDQRYYAVYEDFTVGSYSIGISINSSVYPNTTIPLVHYYDLLIQRRGLDPYDGDFDDDGLNDSYEVKHGINPFLVDTDGDTLNDYDEIYVYGSDPRKVDTDDDNLTDTIEVNDSDGFTTNPADPDTDDDGLSDGDEDQNKSGSVNTGETDPNNWDSDYDTMPDGWEVNYNLNPVNPADAHGNADTDGLNNSQEYTVDTIPTNSDTDNDNLTDDQEITGILFRTNITKGAVSIDYYPTQSGFKWIFYNGSKYQYNSTHTNVSNTSSSFFGKNTSNVLVSVLDDGSTVMYNGSLDEIYVWEPWADFTDQDSNGTLEGTYYSFNSTVSEEPLTTNIPEAGYRDMEIYNGTSPFIQDTDGDGIFDGDEKECLSDTDGDGIPNNLDTDSDNDGIIDGEEIGWDQNSDSDSILYNMLDPDSDNDEILDGTEPLWYMDIDDDGLENMIDVDSDNDKLNDGIEDWNYNGSLDENETNMIDVDTDNDGVIDSVELDWNISSDSDYLINARDWDSDDDGVTDGNEVRVVFRTNAINGVFNVSTWINVALNQSAWNSSAEPPYGYALTGFWYNSSSATPLGQLLGYTFENDEIRYDEENETIYVDTTEFLINNSGQLVNSTQPTLTFTKNRGEVIVFYNISDGDNVYNALDNDSDDDGLLDGYEDLDNDGIIDSDETDPYMQDTDKDGVPDGIEDADLNGSRESSETNPLNVDSDGDELWDGWKDLDGDSIYDPFEYGEDINANGTVEEGETDPLLTDSDGDGLADDEETVEGVYWVEAENYLVSGASKVLNGTASTGSNITFDVLSNGSYQLFIMAKSAIGGGNNVTFGIYKATNVTIKNETRLLTSEYHWFETEPFNITSLDLPVSLRIPEEGNDDEVYIDKAMLVCFSNETGKSLSINHLYNSSTERILNFNSSNGENKTVFLEIPSYAYVSGATMDLVGMEYTWGISENLTKENGQYPYYFYAWHYSLALGDLDQDNDMDIVASNNTLGSGWWFDDVFGFGIHEQYQNHSWSPRDDIVTGELYIDYLAVDDLDGDGDDDIATVGKSKDESQEYLQNKIGNVVSIFTRDVEGNWSVTENLTEDLEDEMGEVLGLAIGDLDEDNDNDIVVIDRIKITWPWEKWDYNIKVFIQNENNWTNIDLPKGPEDPDAFPYSVAIGDLDEDNDNDIAVHFSNGTAIIWEQTPEHDWNLSKYLYTNSCPDEDQWEDHTDRSLLGNSIAIGDIDEDNDNDIIVGNQCPTYPYNEGEFQNVGIFKQDAEHNWSEMETLDADYYPYSVIIKDMDSDGDNDVAITDSNSVGLYIQDSEHNFSSEDKYWVGYPLISLAAADFDENGDVEIAVCGQSYFGYVTILKVDYWPARYPIEVMLDIGNNSYIDWSHSGKFSSKETTQDQSAPINSYICSYNRNFKNDTILVPFRFYSDVSNIFEISNLSIQYRVAPTNPADYDSDDDGLSDGYEKKVLISNPFDFDTDNDGIQDGTELGLTSPMGGGTSDTFQSDIDPFNNTFYNNRDTDNDGLVDGFLDENDNFVCDDDESGEDKNVNGKSLDVGETDPLDADTDNDGLSDKHGENRDGDAYLEMDETDPLDIDTDDDGLWDGHSLIYNSNLYLGEKSIGTNSTNNDTDGDGLQDGTEIGLYYNTSYDHVLSDSEAVNISSTVKGTDIPKFVSDEDTGTTTDPLNLDTDNDYLPDGWIDGYAVGGWEDEGYITLTEGEDYNRNGRLDPGETAPYLLDTDRDGKDDKEEVRWSYNAYWFEAEDHLGSNAEISADNKGANGTKIVIPDQEDTPPLYLGPDNYMFYVKANKTTESEKTLWIAVLNKTNEILVSINISLDTTSKWYNTPIFEVTEEDNPISLYAPYPEAAQEILIDKTMLLKDPVESPIDSVLYRDIRFSDSNEEVKTYINYIPGAANFPLNIYVKNASMTITGVRGPDNDRLINSTGSAPSIAIDYRGVIYIVWETDNRIVLNKSLDGGLTFEPGMRVDDDTGNPLSEKRNPAIAVDNNRNIFVVWEDARDENYSIYLARSMDGGLSFSSDVRVNTTDGCYQLSPAIAVNLDNEIFITWEDNRTGDYDIYVSKSNDKGRTFNPSVRVNDDTNNDQKIPDIAITSQGLICVVWADKRDNFWDVYFANSTDNGSSFGTNVEVNDGGSFHHQPTIAIDKSERIFVAWRDSRLSQGGIYFARSLDKGASFEQNLRVDNTVGDRPSMVVDSYGTIYLAWRSKNYGDINISVSVDSGESFENQTVVNDNISMAGLISPVIAANNMGVVGLVWYSNQAHGIHFDSLPFPSNVTLDVGDDGDIQWYCKGQLSGTVVIEDFYDEINENGNVLTFSSEGYGRILIREISVGFVPDVSSPTCNDTDGDKISDGYETNVYFTCSLDLESDNDMIGDYMELTGFGTHPGRPDTDHDGLFDGFKDTDGDKKFDLLSEVGEDTNIDGLLDWNETDPLDPDSDNDGLLDGYELVPGVLWFRAENHSAGQVISDNNASYGLAVENPTGFELVDDDSFPSVPVGDYMLYFRAKSNLSDIQHLEYFSSGMGDWISDKTGSGTDINADSEYLKVVGVQGEYANASNTEINVPSSGDYTIEFDYKYPFATEITRFLVWGIYNSSGPDIEIWQSNDKLFANDDPIAFVTLTNTVWHHFEIVSLWDETFEIYLDYALVYNSTKVENGSSEIFGRIGDTEEEYTGTGNWDNIRLTEISHINATVRTTQSGVIWKTFPAFEDYRWYYTSPFAVGESGSFEVDINDSDASKATVYVDELILVELLDSSALGIYTTNEADNTVVFGENENITIYIELKIGDSVPLYIITALMDIAGQDDGEGNNTKYPYLNLGSYGNISIPRANLGVKDYADCNLTDLENMTLPQWAWYFGNFTPQNGTQRILDFSGEINRYIKDHIMIPGMVNESGYMRIPLEFHSDNAGKLVLSNIRIELTPYLMDPLNNDTDGDRLLDGDESLIWTSSLKWDSDNDGLYDVVEPVKYIGTDPLDSDTENDLLMDGNSDELKVIFRVGNGSGEFTGYNESTWIAIQNLTWISQLGMYAPDVEYMTSRLIGYGYAGSISDLSTGAWKEIVFNTTEDYQLCYETGSGNVSVKVGEGDYRIYNMSDSDANLALNLTQPLVKYALSGLEIYSNAALTADRDKDGLIDGIESALGLSSSDADCDDDGLLDGIEYYFIGTDPLCNDSDDDGVQDGTEFGLTLGDVSELEWNTETNSLIKRTNLTLFIPDLDPLTTTDPLDTDSDKDGIYDGFKDLNNNNVSDANEPGEDRNGDGKAEGQNETDAANPDTDGDGLTDGYGENWDGDVILENGETHPLDVDTDDDGLWDGFTVMFNNTVYLGELSLGTNARSNDTDYDGVQDGTEIGLYYNSTYPSEDIIIDNCEAEDIWAGLKGTNISLFISDEDRTNTTDPVEDDTDGDGLIDGNEDENANGRFEDNKTETDPLNKDTDFDRLWDGVEDVNSNGIFEIGEGNPNDKDTDDDGLADGDERKWDEDTDDDGEINIRDSDSDDDGIIDGVEAGIITENKTVGGFGYNGTDGIYYGDVDPENTTDPLNPDTDGDFLKDGFEDENYNGLFEDNKTETDPNNMDTDFDGIWDGVEDVDQDGYFDEGTNETDPNDCDTDDDGIKDGFETLWDYDIDGDGLVNALDSDSDSDNLTDGVEAGITNETAPVGGFGFNGTNLTVFFGDPHPSSTTEPYDTDSDNDGLPDGWVDGWIYSWSFGWGVYGTSDGQKQIWEGEDLDLDGWYNMTGGAINETDPRDTDSDLDGIADGIEAYFGLDPTYIPDALEDMDSDNLTNLEEYLQGVNSGDSDIDCDNDELINFNDVNDDNDIFLTEYEVYHRLDPYFNDEYKDLDGDGLTNIYEYNESLDPSDPDTDYDGLWDGWVDENGNLIYDSWEIKGELGDVNNNGIGGWNTGVTNPDSDGDTLWDGDEVAGWWVFLEYYEYWVQSDPLVKDYDGDDFNDSKEYLRTDPNNDDTDGDGLIDYIAENGTGDGEVPAGKDIDPTSMEDIPPKIIEVDQWHDLRWGWVWGVYCIEKVYLKVTVEASDNAAMNNVNLTFKDTGKIYECKYIGNGEWETKFEIDFWKDYTWGYEVEVRAYDVAGNVMAKTVGGGLEYIIGQLVSAILSFFLGPTLAGTVIGFFVGMVAGLFEDLSIFLQIGEIFEGMKQIGKLIPTLISNPGMIFDMIKNSLYGIINKAFNYNPFGDGGHNVETWLDNIIALLGDFFDNWEINNQTLKNFISMDANLYNLAFTVTHLVGYMIQQFVLTGGAGFVMKTVGSAVVGSLKAIKAALMTSDMVMEVAQAAARVARAVAEGFSRVVGDIATKLSGGKITKLSDTAFGGFIVGMCEKGQKWMDELAEKIKNAFGLDKSDEVLTNYKKGKELGIDGPMDDILDRAKHEAGAHLELEKGVDIASRDGVSNVRFIPQERGPKVPDLKFDKGGKTYKIDIKGFEDIPNPDPDDIASLVTSKGKVGDKFNINEFDTNGLYIDARKSSSNSFDIEFEINKHSSKTFQQKNRQLTFKNMELDLKTGTRYGKWENGEWLFSDNPWI